MPGSVGKEEAESLLSAARDADISLPKGKKECIGEAKIAIEGAMRGDGSNGYNEEAALQALEIKYGKKKKKKAKRKAEDSEIEGPEKVPAAKSVAKMASVLNEVWDISDKAKRKEVAVKLCDLAKTRGIKMPEGEDQMRVGAGRALMGVKNEKGEVKVKDVLEELKETYGVDPTWVDPDETSKPKKKAKSKATPAVCPENEEIAELFKELAGIYFKEGSKAGMVYQKVCTAIKSLDYVLTEAPKKKQIPGVGDKTIAKMKEYFETGKIELLEEKRAEALEI